jgi:hypothetical protein
MAGPKYKLKFRILNFFPSNPDDDDKNFIYYAPAGSKFMIISSDKEYYEVEFTGIGADKSPPQAGPELISLFFISEDAPATKVEALKPVEIEKNPYKVKRTDLPEWYYDVLSGWDIGLLAVPFKIRTQDKVKITGGSTIGAYIGPRLKSVSVVGAFGLGPIELNNAGSEVTNSELGFTLAIGLVIEPATKFQIGIITGFDWINEKDEIKWKYQGKPWISAQTGFRFTTR